MDPKHLGWRSTAQWLAEASAIFDGLSGFVVFGDTAGIVAAAASGNGRERWSAILDTVAGQLSRLCGVTILGDGIFYCVPPG
jgi:hypothetical protein